MEERKCEKCGKELKWYNQSWNGRICNKCFQEPINAVLKIIIGGIILGIFLIWLFSSHGSTNSDNTNQQTQTPVLSVTDDQIMQDYASNEINANAKYQNNIILVSGTIYEVAQDWDGGYHVTLREQYDYNGVECFFKSNTELMNLHKGEMITLRGQVSGFISGMVGINDCSVSS